MQLDIWGEGNVHIFVFTYFYCPPKTIELTLCVSAFVFIVNQINLSLGEGPYKIYMLSFFRDFGETFPAQIMTIH